MAGVDDVAGAIVQAQGRPIREVWKGYKRFCNGDVIFAKITPCMENGKAAVVHGMRNGIGLGSTEFHVLRPSVVVLPEWIYHCVRRISFRKDAKRAMTGTAGQLRVSAGFIENAAIPLAPLQEQVRILKVLQQQFTRLDAAVAALKRAQANLHSYKASVLKAACEGKLVPQDQHDEHTSDLLKRILAERRAKWEEDVRSKGKDPKKEKYSEPEPADTEGLTELCMGWTWVTIEQLASPEPRSIQSGPFGSSLHHSEFQKTGVLVIGIDNVLDGRFSMGRHHFISEEKYEQLRKYTARPLDVLITVMATVGRCCVVPLDLETAIVTKHVYRISCDNRLVNPYYLMLNVLGGTTVREQLYEQAQGQTRPGINGEILRRIVVPLPPRVEQDAIVAECDGRLSNVHEVSTGIDINVRRADRLQRAILKRAFEGKLVPQDPNDEPAAVLLERIRAERRGRHRKSGKSAAMQLTLLEKGR